MVKLFDHIQKIFNAFKTFLTQPIFFFELADGSGISAAPKNFVLAQKLNLINGNDFLVLCLILLNEGPKIFWAG